MLQQTADDIYAAAAAAGARPDPLLTISEWADQYRVLSTRASAEPGPWRTDRTPYLREIMDCLSPSSLWERVVLMSGAQIGKTEAGNNWIGYVIHQAPGPMMAVQPTVEMAKRNSKQRIDPLIEDCEVLRKLVRDPRSRDSGNTVLAKEFPGGILVMTGANSAVGLRSMAARYVFLDEVDAYPGDVDGEGDPVNLALARTRTFSRRKVLLTSTPGITGLSRIAAAFEESDQRYYWLPCPHCFEFQILKFGQLQWPKGKPAKAAYVCEHCQGIIENHHKQWMLPRGQWRASAAGDGKTAGFHLSSLYSPVGWFSWGEAAKQWEDAQKDPSLLQVFINTVLGETWDQQGEVPDWQRLYDRREHYTLGKVPAGALFLTAGGDVQKDRIEVQVVGWGRNKESWLVDYAILEGDTSRPEVWHKLTNLVGTTYVSEAGANFAIVRFGIDSGFATQEVYAWARQQGPGRILVMKGYETGAAPLGLPSATDVNKDGKRLKRGCRVWPVATGILKTELYGWLRQEKPTDEDLANGALYPAGYLHLPELGEEFFRQLTAERLVVKVTNGVRRAAWVAMRPRNEALDTRIYARAAAIHYGIDRFGEKHWRQLEAQAGASRAESEYPAAPAHDHGLAPAPAVRPAAGPSPAIRRPARRRVIRSNYIGRW